MPPPKPPRPPPKVAIVEIEPDEEPVPSFRNQKTRTAAVVAIIGTVCAGLASIVVPIAQSYLSRPPPPKDNSEEVMKALKGESERQNKEIQKLHGDVTELRSWVKGYLTAQGYGIKDPPDTNAPAGTDVVIEPKPVKKKATALAPSPQVKTPLPLPRPLTRAKEIPEPVVPDATP